MIELAFVVVGVVVGSLAGLIGIAGGVFLVPALVLLFHFPQKMAQGTTLAVLLPPIGLGAAYLYYRAGNVNVKAAALLAVGFLVGGFIGGALAGTLPEQTIQRYFGAFMVLVGLKMLFFK
jgi:uncharacterized membrane protein YfcA